MNTSIQQIKQVLVDNNVTSINKGVEVLVQYFNGFEFHECKEEWLSMKRDEKRSFVKKLLETDEITDEVTESDIDDGLVEITDEQTEEVTAKPTELQQLVQQEVSELQEQIKQLEEQIKPLKERLFDLTGQSDKSETKMEKAVRIFENNKGLKRKDMLILFQNEAGLTKAGSATYYNNIVNSKK